jgi:hypothetical protein
VSVSKLAAPEGTSGAQRALHLGVVSSREQGTITELCSGESLPEVEIISLLEEQIPKYKLRADTLTKFGGESKFFFRSNFSFTAICGKFCKVERRFGSHFKKVKLFNSRDDKFVFTDWNRFERANEHPCVPVGKNCLHDY